MEDKAAKYERVTKRVKELKGFYNHVKIFILVNGFLFALQQGWLDWVFTDSFPVQRFYFDWVTANILVWLLILGIHALITFKNKLPFLKKWEEQKIESLMREEDERNKK